MNNKYSLILTYKIDIPEGQLITRLNKKLDIKWRLKFEAEKTAVLYIDYMAITPDLAISAIIKILKSILPEAHFIGGNITGPDIEAPHIEAEQMSLYIDPSNNDVYIKPSIQAPSIQGPSIQVHDIGPYIPSQKHQDN